MRYDGQYLYKSGWDCDKCFETFSYFSLSLQTGKSKTVAPLIALDKSNCWDWPGLLFTSPRLSSWMKRQVPLISQLKRCSSASSRKSSKIQLF